MQNEKIKKMLDFLKEAGIIEPNETGKVICHFNNGGITKITKPDKNFLRKEESALIKN